MPQFGPEPEVVIAGLPVRQVVGHHAPRPTRPDDVEDAVDDIAPRMLLRTPSQSVRLGRQKAFEDFPFGIRHAAWITGHAEFLQYMTKLVQIKIRKVSIFKTASQGISRPEFKTEVQR